jgi:hypothetical protein
VAVKSLYFKNAAPSGAATSLSLQDGGTAPATGITTTGWVVARLASPNLSAMVAGTERASNTFTTADAIPTFAAAACWRTENPVTGQFANANWSLAFRVRAVSAASSQTGAVKVRIWKSANADGTGATQLTSAVLTGTTTAALSTTVSATSTVTWSPGAAVALANEYIWVQCEWSIVVASGSNQGDVDFYIESAGVVTTPNFVVSYAMPAVTGAVALSMKAADLDVDRRLVAANGVVAAVGSAATLTLGHNYKLLAATASAVVAGGDAVLRPRRVYRVTADQGGVVLSAIDAALKLRKVYALLAEPGGIYLTGYAAALSATSAKAMLAAMGTVSSEGSETTLTYTPAGGFTLTAAPGGIYLTGAAELRRTRVPPIVPATPVGRLTFGVPRSHVWNVFRW